MIRSRFIYTSVALLFIGLIGLSSCTGMFRWGMTDGGMMMDREGMKDIMQGMMGDVLPPGIDPALLPESQSQGALLLARYCSQCHNLPGPGTHTAEEWPAVVERMNRRMQMMSGPDMMGMMVDSPNESELQAILRYLQEYAQKPIDKAQYDDLDTSAGRAFQSTCSLCHALPDPQQHTAEEWPAVVVRMRQNMVTQGKTVPNEATIGEIVGFLQRHAKRSE
jgi:cytochrome c2